MTMEISTLLISNNMKSDDIEWESLVGHWLTLLIGVVRLFLSFLKFTIRNTLFFFYFSSSWASQSAQLSSICSRRSKSDSICLGYLELSGDEVDEWCKRRHYRSRYSTA